MNLSLETTLSPSRGRFVGVYGGLLVLSLALLGGIHWLGGGLSAPPPAAPATAAAAQGASHDLFHVLLALLVIVLVSRGMGVLFRRIGQPPVVGEVIAGIALGPSLLGALAPSVSQYILPPAIAPHLGVLAQLGVVLFMFLVGLELNTGLLRDKPHAAIAISHASIVAPFLLGALLSLWLYPLFSNSAVPFTVFSLFMGVALSITAFPVLARILIDRGLDKSRLGVIAISCAAVDDVTAWCLLALVASMAAGRGQGGLLTIVLTVAYIAAMWTLVRPLIERYVRRVEARGEFGRTVSVVVIAALLVSALITEAIGIHAIFGAFFLGALIPHHSQLAVTLKAKLEDLVVVLLLPAFFAFTGMRTQIGLLSSLDHWLICGLIILAATVGKLGGSFVAARAAGLSTRDAASLGALMNTRGLVELVVLNLGLDLGVISPLLFAMMVLMAIVTTFATSPLLTLFGTPSPKPA
jgi:Kef-type K+ transport system membrane component KefB